MFRIGIANDTHRLIEDRPLMLGSVSLMYSEDFHTCRTLFSKGALWLKKALHKNLLSTLVRVSGRLILAKQFTAGIAARRIEVREADG
jgi:2C-methyl-D-erythritol 2,4-cyclodiphosphate synthase